MQIQLLLSLCILVSLSYAEGIDSLLNTYEQESELSKKTKDESAGNLIVYTRDDLERMQVESLKDILKSLRLFSYAENRLGQPDILNHDPFTYFSKSVRVYLNEHELLTAITGSGLILFGDMEMDFIDHVEIYVGFPSFDFGVEPATTVIRLYSKMPEHDEGGRVKATMGSYGTNKQNVYYTNKEDGISYFIYANHNDVKKDTYSHDGETLRRDLRTNRFYGSIGTQNHNLDFHVMETKGDVFLSSFVGSTPQSTDIETSFINLSTNSKFLNDSLKLNLSYINTTNDLAYRFTTPVVASPVLSITSYKQKIKEEAFTANLKKEWEISNHTVTTGIQYRHKNFDLTDIKFDVPISPINQAYYNENIYSLFLEDSIAINENHLISLSAMQQLYQHDKDVEDIDLTQFRLGYTYSNKEWVSKTFLSKQEFAPEPYMTISPQYGNENLRADAYASILQELSYTTPTTISKIVLAYGKSKNIPILVPDTEPDITLNKGFIVANSSEKITLHSAAAEFTLMFSQKDKLELQANYLYYSSLSENIKSSITYNYVIRMLNTISKFDIFNELVIYDGFSNTDIGYNYSAGIKYQINKDFHINLKGENIFDSGSKWSYINKVDLSGNITDKVIVPTIERQVTFGMEYLF